MCCTFVNHTCCTNLYHTSLSRSLRAWLPQLSSSQPQLVALLLIGPGRGAVRCLGIKRRRGPKNFKDWWLKGNSLLVFGCLLNLNTLVSKYYAKYCIKLATVVHNVQMNDEWRFSMGEGAEHSGMDLHKKVPMIIPSALCPSALLFLGSNRLEDFVATGVTRSAEEDSTRDRFSARKVPKNIEAKDFMVVAKLTSLKKSTQRRVHQALLNWTGAKSWRSLSNASNTFT